MYLMVNVNMKEGISCDIPSETGLGYNSNGKK